MYLMTQTYDQQEKAVSIVIFLGLRASSKTCTHKMMTDTLFWCTSNTFHHWQKGGNKPHHEQS